MSAAQLHRRAPSSSMASTLPAFLLVAAVMLAQLQQGQALTDPQQKKLLIEFRDIMSKRSNNWVNAFETWTCPTNVTNTDDADGCDPCGRTYIGNWDHFYCRGPSNGTGESGKGLYDGFVSNIHICDTHIDGPVPRELCAFSKLRELDLDGGHLTGPIPEWLVDCFQALAELDLSYNRLSGTLPAALARAPDLQEVKLEWNNNLIGTIPSEYGDMARLRVLRLEYNSLHGTIPESFRQRNETLTDIQLADNDFSGDLSALEGATLLLTTTHSNPQLCGMIPAGIRYAKGFNPYNTSLGVPCDLAKDRPGLDGFSLAKKRLDRMGYKSSH